MPKLFLLAALAVAVGACAAPDDASTDPAGLGPIQTDGAAASSAEPESTEPESTETDKTADLSFEPGASRATVSDTLVRFALHDYLVRAAAGQTLTATVTSDGPPTVLVIENDGYQPGGFDTVPAEVNEAGSSADASDGWTWRGTLPRDGVYRVRVAHSGPAANGGAVSSYTLAVEVE